jgi:hypothetical protein
MRSFMTSVSLTWGVELDEGPDGSHTMPFHEENAVMMVYGGRPLSGRRRMSSPTQGPNSLWLRTRGLRGVTTQVFHHPNKIPMFVCVCIY